MSTAELPIATKTFTLFPLLPREIREHIWQYFFTGASGHTLFMCRRRHWISHDKCCFQSVFLDEMLKVECSIASAEVRPDTLRWAQRNGFDVQVVDDRTTFARGGFRGDRDVMYGYRWRECCRELYDGTAKHKDYVSGVQAFAFHEDNMKLEYLEKFLIMFPHLQRIYVIYDMEWPEKHEWCEIGPSYGGGFYWDKEAAAFSFRSDEQDRREGIRRITTTKPGTIDVDTTRYEFVEGLSKSLIPILVTTGRDSCEIRPVGVVKRSIASFPFRMPTAV